MKPSHLKTLPILALLFVGALFSSCESETVKDEETIENLTNHELIKENLEIYQDLLDDRKGAGIISDTYFCSESGGGYTPMTYVNHTVYLNRYYVPSNRNNIGNLNRYASWGTNLQDWLTHKFNDTNPSGSNSATIYMDFEIYGAGGGTSLDAFDGNRAYNEFVCQMMDQLNLSTASQLDNYKFYMDITVDYFLCCSGSSCCNPRLIAQGTAYYN